MMDSKNKQPFIEQGEGNIGIHDINQDSHDTITNHTVNQNQTVVYSGEVAREKLQSEKIDEYRQFCKRVITSQFIDKDLKMRLQEKALSLSLDESVAMEIEEHVKSTLASSGLSQQEFKTINLAKDGIKANDVKPTINRIIALADSKDQEDIQYYANLMLVVEDPRKCISRYERASFDNYWQMFWVYLAYLRQRNPEMAEKVRIKLSANTEKSEELLSLLGGAGCLVEYFANNAGESYRNTAMSELKEYSGGDPLLYQFVEALKVVVSRKRPLYFTDNKELNFYLRIFGAREKLQSSPFAQASNQSFAIDSTKSVYDIADNVAEKTASRPAGRSIAATAPVSSASTTIQKQTTITPEYVQQTDSGNGGGMKKFIYIAVAVVALIWYCSKGSSSDKSNVKEAEELEVVENITETTDEKQTVEKSKRSSSSKAEYSQNTSSKNEASQNTYSQAQESGRLAETSQPAASSSQTTVSSQPAPATPVATAPTAAPAELSASELLAKGKSAVKKFKAEQGAEYFRQAIAKGSVEANYYLGELYYNGNGVAKSFPTAKTYFQKAAQAGMSDAQYMMGVMYRNGQGGDKNINEARRWLEKAAAQGNSNAERLLNQLK